MNEINVALHRRLRCCHYCGQQLPDLRLGVKLTPLKAHLYDLIQRGGDDGILSADLRSIMAMNGNTLKSHINQINTAIAGRGYRLYGRRGIVRLVKTPPLRKKRN